MGAKKSKPSLLAVSVEIVSDIASLLDDKDLASFRQTSKQIEMNTFDVFIARNTPVLRVRLTVDDLTNNVQIIQGLTAAKKVSKVVFIESGRRPTDADATRLRELLHQLLGMLPLLKEVEVSGGQQSSMSVQSHPTTAVHHLLQVLGETSTQLTGITINNIAGGTPVAALTQVLTQHKTTLKSVSFRLVRCLGSGWRDVLDHIREQSTLDRLSLSNLYDVGGGTYGICFQDLQQHQIIRAFRNSTANKIEHYAVGHADARMMGTQAISEGIAVILLHMHSL